MKLKFTNTRIQKSRKLTFNKKPINIKNGLKINAKFSSAKFNRKLKLNKISIPKMNNILKMNKNSWNINNKMVSTLKFSKSSSEESELYDAELESDLDFQPITKSNSTKNMDFTEIYNNDIKNNDLFLYMKGEPDAPMCGFSKHVVALLQFSGVSDIPSRNILEDVDLKESIKEQSEWPTFPQLYIKGELVGGCDIVNQLYEEGELQDVLKDVLPKAEKDEELDEFIKEVK